MQADFHSIPINAKGKGRRLNLIVHNVTEPTNKDGLIRKKHDTDFIASTFQQYLGVSVTINKAFRLGQ